MKGNISFSLSFNFNCMKQKFNRREFISMAAAAGTGLAVAGPNFALGQESKKPAILGGSKAYTSGFSAWPLFDDREEKALVSVLKSGNWGRLNGPVVAEFEKAYAGLNGAGHCLGVSSGTAA